MNIKTSIIGVSGYTGLELVKLLLTHRHFTLSSLYASESHRDIASLHPSLKSVINLPIKEANKEKIAQECELAFLALPHQKAMEYAKTLLEKNIKVVDLSADYRLSLEKYEQYYCSHSDKENLKNAVYGLVEYNRAEIAKTNLVANPGCYPTATLLALLPFAEYLDNTQSVYIDAKSGVSGAGKKLVQTSHFATINENLFAYSPISHRHSPEINEQLKKISKIQLKTLFVPHLIPLTRGMLVSIYAHLKEKIDPLKILHERYKDEPFIRVRESCAQIKNVAGTHFCDIYAKADEKDLFITSSIDNLLRGASSQALANANLMFGLDESLGLPKIAYAP
ncbi:N-acetyl-gamma-glutamyl-phosphate reductase [Helicobacter winghamensis]|uniref:N-acetyl-gamma-glutamyl-phosphate reductase n=1 Tax=Helicobacter winghamensis TaxID=157268 RepID=A0A2N3PKC8_9HELI|nr:N-acetyl-gamma-glutamyl-phosphate reductase [Helicobacter winghamensis]PKT77636.1 N-acetyl-gamma-glutamyl-phosphate reductase [Helicobacter winghamensis]PKT81874.1 N-acetyl-gamma-glutamyl-phosphate reductase [Helicobacter winghamensis]PKT82053.1 N-acetyl-gamma-glutamyl-phosphate reductase [Helicobacter winghamensis]